ncbi:MAG: CRTAC1 family protein [Bryobacterales bacterium]|nr:CRTAC1 family protein [Bryobacteraceae bacterium]MDW8354056.1 CRTAC1 family protein [Bryobacterales bacterium]
MRGWTLTVVVAAALLRAELPTFSDVTASSGLSFRNHASLTSEKYLIESMTGGVALFDYDGDGLLDVFLVNGAALADPMPAGKQPDKSDPRYWNRLYRNLGNFRFADVTEKAGVRGHSYGMGAAVGDYDNDGRPDLYVTNFGRNILYRNNGDGTFTDVTDKAGVAASGWSVGAVFVDYDRDGLLDLFVARYLDWDFSKNIYCGERKPGYRAYCHPDQFEPIHHLLYRNNGDGTFTNVSDQAGIAAHPGKGLGVAIEDFDRDGWTDIFVANDSFPQQLFRNKGDGTFEETALLLGAAYDEDGRTFAGMGVDFADYDNDGWPDVFVNALANQKYALFRNAKGSFEYVSGPSGVAGITMLHSGWGTRFLDYDNDGWKDLLVGQGHVMDNIELTQPNIRYLEPLLLMRNRGGKFEDVSRQAGAPFQVPLAARGIGFGDLNNDGFVDLVVNCNDRPALVLRNDGGNGNHWLLVNVVGTRSNRDGIGARLRLVSESGLEQHAIVTTASSYLSASDKRVHFGLGKDARVKLLEITWPSGVVQKLEQVAGDRILTVREPADSDGL